MKTVILCGGRGTRIRDVAGNVPKPLIPVGNAPILWHIMKHYAHYGHKEFILCLGHQGDAIRDFFLNYRTRTADFTITLGTQGALEFHDEAAEASWTVTLAETGAETMTGGRVKKIEKYLEGEDFFLTYGDGLSDVDLAALEARHRQEDKTLTVTGVVPTGRFGEIIAGAGGLVTGFNEKPRSSGGRVSGGFFACKPALFDYLEAREDLVFELEPMARLVKDKQLVMFPHDGFWQPMDTYRDYALLNALWSKGEAPWKLW